MMSHCLLDTEIPRHVRKHQPQMTFEFLPLCSGMEQPQRCCTR